MIHAPIRRNRFTLVLVFSCLSTLSAPTFARDVLLGERTGPARWTFGNNAHVSDFSPSTVLAAALAITELDLDAPTRQFDFDHTLVANRQARQGELEVFHFEARREGRRLLDYALRIVVDRDAGSLRLVSVRGAGRIAAIRSGELAASQALAIAEAAYPRLDLWTSAEPVWTRVGSSIHASWRLLGHQRNSTYESLEIIVDGSNGQIVRSRSAIRNFDVTGTVSGFGSPGLLPDVGYNPASIMPLENLTVSSGGTSAATGSDGSFVLDVPGPTATINAALEGPWVRVQDFYTGTTMSLTSSTAAPGTADFVFGPGSNPDAVGAVNCFIHVNTAHEFIVSRNPSFTQIDVPVVCEVGVPFPCVAGFDPYFGSLIFSTVSGLGGPAGGCTGLAMSTIIVHEYGHFVHLGLGIQDAAFGEGYGDALAALVFDSPISGQDVFGPGIAGRDVSSPDVQYPCFAPDPHECGLVLAGVWWDLKIELQGSLGPVAGLETARQLFVDWSAITAGGDQAAHPGTAIEVLTIDDDDGDITDGTPNFDEICAAFALHGIDCPVITPPTSVDFVRGDCNRDGTVDVSDPVFDLNVQFLGELATCVDGCDGNDDGLSDISDPVYILAFLFAAGTSPPDPFPSCGPDPTADALPCQASSICP